MEQQYNNIGKTAANGIESGNDGKYIIYNHDHSFSENILLKLDYCISVI